MGDIERFMLMLGASGYTAAFMLPAAELVLAQESAARSKAVRACQGGTGTCEAGCHRLSERRVDRVFARMTAGLRPD